MDAIASKDQLQKIFSNSKDNKKILIIPNTKNNQDIYFACLGLATGFNSINHKAFVVSSKLALDKLWRYRLQLLNISNIYEKLPTQLAIQFKRSALDVQGVSLQTLDDIYQITLDTSSNNASLPKQTAIKEIATKFDIVIFVGSPTLDNLIELGWSQNKILKEQVILVTNSKVKVPDDLNNIFIFQGSYESFSLKARDMFHDLQIQPNVATTTLLLAGLLSFSDDFKKNIEQSLFQEVANLLELGADYYQASNLALNDLSIKKVEFLAEVYSNIKKLHPGVYFVFSGPSTKEIPRLKTQDLLKICRISDCRLAYVYIESPKGKRVYFKANDTSIKLKQILKSLHGKGNNYDGLVHTDLDLATFNKTLLVLLGGESQSANAMPLDKATQMPPPLQLTKLLHKRKSV